MALNRSSCNNSVRSPLFPCRPAVFKTAGRLATSRGAPRRIRNPEGAETLLTRGDTRFPSLVTAVRSSNAAGDSLLLQSSATYDTLALVTRSVSHNPRGDLRNDTTVIIWDTKWRRPQNVFQRSTGQQIGTTTITYDSVTGNMTSQLVGTASRRVNYTYWTTGAGVGQLASIRYPHPTTGVAGGGGIDSVYYDAMGNVRSTRSPLGFRSVVVRDALGRDSISYSPIDSIRALTESDVQQYGASSRVSYNVMDIPVLTVSHGPARAHAIGPDAWKPRDTPAEEISVTTYYDDMGRTLGVTTTASPIAATTEHEFEYDRAGRKTSERVGTVTQEYTYDKAGNVVTWTTPQNFQIHSSFDVMGRPLRRSRPSTGHFPLCLYPLADHQQACTSTPYLPNNLNGGYTIASDTTFYRYDLLGRMVFAQNNDAIVERSYLPNGAVRTDTTRMRQYAGAQFTQHVYGIEYGYDRMGRLSWLRHPTNLALFSTAQVDSFTYDAVTGAPSTARDRNGVAFSFHQDLMGRPTSTHMPGIGSAALIDSTVYDIGSRVTRRMTGSASNPSDMMDERMQYDARGKTIRVELPNGTASVSMNWYSGLGNLVGTEWDNVAGNGNTREEYVIDALGNIREKRAPLQSGNQYPHDYHYAYDLDPVNNRVRQIVKRDTLPIPWTDHLDFDADSATRSYDPSGNMTVAMQAVELGTNGSRAVVTRNFYSSDSRLYATHHFDLSPSGTANGSWEEYRYDPLGRRIIVRTVREGLCSGGGIGAPGPVCQSTITRYVWSGDQILWELRAPGAAGDNLEATNGSAAPSNHAIRFGRVSYLHAGGIDRPLTITKDAQEPIIPHQNWRGAFAWGTWGKGTSKGYQSDCVSGIPSSSCANVAWPGWQTNAWHVGGNPGEQEYWMGSLADGQRNVNGQIYMRNRYYDPATGQFTQTDPIGLAGGLNAYGFAAGDPVTYSDPYGLAACDKVKRDDCSKSELIVLGVADRLAPVAPALNVLAEIIFIASPDPLGEGVLIVGGVRHVARAADKLLEGRRFNPFRGRTAQEIEDMFLRKGFEPRGPNPVGGRGGYVNPRNGRSYHIDEANSFNEPPHVDVNRLRGYKGPLDKRKFDM